MAHTARGNLPLNVFDMKLYISEVTHRKSSKRNWAWISSSKSEISRSSYTTITEYLIAQHTFHFLKQAFHESGWKQVFLFAKENTIVFTTFTLNSPKVLSDTRCSINSVNFWPFGPKEGHFATAVNAAAPMVTALSSISLALGNLAAATVEKIT